MRLAVDGGGYATAASAFTDANHLAALQYDVLTGKLAGYAAMAGDDATSTGFAAAYDESAREAVAALADLVDSFASLGQLTHASLANHRRANAASVMGGAIVYEGATLPEDGYVSVLPSTPPSSLGGDPPVLSPEANWILDHIEGFAWPNADTDRLREAARTWRTAAEGLDELPGYCRAAVRGLSAQQSPEIPVAIAAIDELSTTVGEVAAEFAALASSCELYAAQVDEKREQIRALLREILAMVVEGVLVSVAIGAITGGAGAVAGAGAVVARVAAQAPRFAAILNALRTAAATSASALRTSRSLLTSARGRLAKFVNVTKARSAARGEAGSLNLSAFGPNWLRRNDDVGGHVLGNHAGKTPDELLERLRSDPRLSHASSFADQARAEKMLSRFLSTKGDDIEAWLAGHGRRLRLDGDLGSPTGVSVDRAGDVFHVSGIRAILVRDPSMDDGFHVLTAFPQP